jgi:hypothetical protein
MHTLAVIGLLIAFTVVLAVSSWSRGIGRQRRDR